MGKKRITNKGGSDSAGAKGKSQSKSSRKKIEKGILYVQSTFNNTKVLLTDMTGNAIFWSSTGLLGFKGAKKGTPFAAAKAGETVAEQAQQIGLKEVDVIVKGAGSGRESAVRAFLTKGFSLGTIKDRTPQPFNGPRPPRPRRV